MANVRNAALYGSILAVFVLLLFLRNFRSTLVVAISIPISVVGTFGLMYFYGFTLNIVTFGGLALGVGVLVDNAIVVLESIFRHRQDGMERKEAARQRHPRGGSGHYRFHFDDHRRVFAGGLYEWCGGYHVSATGLGGVLFTAQLTAGVADAGAPSFQSGLSVCGNPIPTVCCMDWFTE